MLSSEDTALIKSTLVDGLDYVFEQWSKPVRLVYSQIATDCPNCIEVGPYGSINQYKPGGPIPFSAGRCPLCGGTGSISDRPFKDTVARIRRYKKNEFNEINPIENPEGIIVVKARMIDLEDFRRCEYMILEPDFKPERRYIRLSEPQDNNAIAQNLYINMLWRSQ